MQVYFSGLSINGSFYGMAQLTGDKIVKGYVVIVMLTSYKGQ